MRWTLRLLLAAATALLTGVVVLGAPGRLSRDERSKAPFYGPLKAFKESETLYHHLAPQVPYYTQRPPGLNGITRKYFLAVEEVDYDYAPLGFDHIVGAPLNETMAATWTVASDTRIGSVYMKAVYREYTDGSYLNRISHPDYMGYFGPIIRAEVGDTVQVTLRNMARYNYSFHVHGLYYNAASDGQDFAGAIGGKSIAPNQQYTYVFDIPERSGPIGADEPSAIWAYYSDVKPTDIYAGLVGPMIVYKKGTLVQFGAPNKTIINGEVVTFLNIADENQSNYFDENVAKYLGPSFKPDPNDGDFYVSNLMYNINGFVFANLDALQLVANQTFRWYLIGLGNEVDIHTAHWHGTTCLETGHRTDVIALLPATFKVVSVVADNPGQWLFHCHVTQHMMGGMALYYQINVASSEHGWSKRSIEEKASFVRTRE